MSRRSTVTEKPWVSRIPNIQLRQRTTLYQYIPQSLRIALHWQWLRNTPLNTRLTQPGDNQRRLPLHRCPANREELGDCVIGTICLLNKIYRHSPPGAKRAQHPEVAGSFHAHGYSASKTVARCTRIRCRRRATVVCEHAASDCTSDGQREETNAENNISCCCSERTRPCENTEYDEPRCEFRKMRMHFVCFQSTGRLSFLVSSLLVIQILLRNAKLTTKAYRIPILIQKLPHMVLITVTNVSLALNPYSPAMNCASPPNSPTNGKKMVGDSGPPHQLAMYDEVIHVEPAKPARPRAAGGAMGWRKIWMPGVCWSVLSSFSDW